MHNDEVLLKENDDLHVVNNCICFVNCQIVQIRLEDNSNLLR